mgnify:CR=1 FL=1
MDSILFPRGVADRLEGLDAYRSRGGYATVERLRELSPQDIIATLEAAGLQGRGGAGFPTAKKLTLTLECSETPHYVIPWVGMLKSSAFSLKKQLSCGWNTEHKTISY